MTRAWCVIVILAAAGLTVGAETNDINYPDDPNELLRSRWEAVYAALESNDINDQVKADKIEAILTPIFDFPLMGKLTLGEKHWPKLTDPQRDEFFRLFEKKIKNSYRDKVSGYNNEKAEMKPPVESRKGVIFIPMEIVSEESKTALLYKLRRVEGRWKVYDVEIEGVSVLLSYRSQFDDILSRGTVEDLLARLAEEPAK